jgi:hypothetical protein
LASERWLPRLSAQQESRPLHESERRERVHVGDKDVSEPADRAPRRDAAQISVFAVFFVVLGLTLIVVGGHDAALGGSPFVVTAASALLLFIGILFVVAAWRLREWGRHELWKGGTRPPCSPLVLAAFVIAVLFGLYVTFAALGTATGTQLDVVVAIALVIVAVAGVGLLFFGGDVKLTLPRVGAVALGLVGTTVGAWEFWYQNQYVPSRAGGTVELKVQLRRTSQAGRFDVVRATVDYQAIGGKSVAVVGSAYTLTGSKVFQCPRDATVKRVADFFGGFLLDPQRLRFMRDVVEQPPTVLAAGKFVADGKRLDPDVPADREFVFYVPDENYQLLRFRAQLFAIPASIRLSERTPPIYMPLPGDNELYGYWHIDDESWLHDLVLGRERWLVLRYELVDPADSVNRNAPAAAAPASQVMHVLARFPPAAWGKNRPSPSATQALFDKPQAINAQEPRDASEPFADSELPLQPIASSC